MRERYEKLDGRTSSTIGENRNPIQDVPAVLLSSANRQNSRGEVASARSVAITVTPTSSNVVNAILSDGSTKAAAPMEIALASTDQSDVPLAANIRFKPSIRSNSSESIELTSQPVQATDEAVVVADNPVRIDAQSGQGEDDLNVIVQDNNGDPLSSTTSTLLSDRMQDRMARTGFVVVRQVAPKAQRTGKWVRVVRRGQSKPTKGVVVVDAGAWKQLTKLSGDKNHVWIRVSPNGQSVDAFTANFNSDVFFKRNSPGKTWFKNFNDKAFQQYNFKMFSSPNWSTKTLILPSDSWNSNLKVFSDTSGWTGKSGFKTWNYTLKSTQPGQSGQDSRRAHLENEIVHLKARYTAKTMKILTEAQRTKLRELMKQDSGYNR